MPPRNPTPRDERPPERQSQQPVRPLQATRLGDLLASGNPVTFLQIGECIMVRRPSLISTVLGSCVSATFHHRSGFGAIFHAILPELTMSQDRRESCRFVDASVALVARRLGSQGIAAREVVVKLFGGALTIEPERKAGLREIVDVGARNVAVARRELSRHGFRVSVEHVLGERGRKLFFWTGTGEVWMKRLLSPSRAGGPGAGRNGSGG